MSARTLLRDCAARILYRSGVTAPKRRSRGRLSIVTFHRVLPEAERRAYPYPGLVVTPQELDAFLNYFTRQFDCGALATQHERFLGGECPDRPLLAVTFDDAQVDNYTNARPVLARHRVKASFFVPVVSVERREPLWHDRLGFAVLALLRKGQEGRGRLMRALAAAGLSGTGPRSLVENTVRESKKLALDKRLDLVAALVDVSGMDEVPEFARIMTFGELAGLASDGHEIGSHSMTHRMMPECDDRTLDYELSESRRVLRARIGREIESFCYPNGDFDTRTASAVAKAGYRRAVTTAWGHNGRDADRFQLRRFDMDATRVRDPSGTILAGLLALRMSGFYPGLGHRE